MVVDPDPARLRQMAAALAPMTVIDAISLHEAFSLVESLQPACLAIAGAAAAEPGLEMFLRLVGAVGARWVVYGQSPPPGLPPGAAWVGLPPGAPPGAVADVLLGRSRATAAPPAAQTRPELIVIGASTGGVAAIEAVLSHFTAESPPTLIVQHIRPGFLETFLSRLDRCCIPHVVAAGDGVVPVRGTVYVAATPECHLVLQGGVLQGGVLQGGPLAGARAGLAARMPPRAAPRMAILPAPPGCPHRPSVDALFQSAAGLGPRIAAALLTGMGADGAQGLADIRAAGGFTIAQDRETSTVWGMPRIAAERGAATAVLPLDQIGPALLAGQAGLPGTAGLLPARRGLR